MPNELEIEDVVPFDFLGLGSQWYIRSKRVSKQMGLNSKMMTTSSRRWGEISYSYSSTPGNHGLLGLLKS
jgi:hypothetical protein